MLFMDNRSTKTLYERPWRKKRKTSLVDELLRPTCKILSIQVEVPSLQGRSENLK